MTAGLLWYLVDCQREGAHTSVHTRDNYAVGARLTGVVFKSGNERFAFVDFSADMVDSPDTSIWALKANVEVELFPAALDHISGVSFEMHEIRLMRAFVNGVSRIISR